MKLFFFIFPSVFLLMAHSCSKKDIKLKEGTVVLPLKKCGSGEIAGNDIRLCFDSVLADSRCPANAMCIWQGTATARFTLTKNNETISFVLNTLDEPPTYHKDTILMGYRIEFVHLLPYPGTYTSPVPADQITAELKITKQ